MLAMVLRAVAISHFVVGAKRELILQLLRRDENLFCTDVYVIERVFCMMLFLSFGVMR